MAYKCLKGFKTSFQFQLILPSFFCFYFNSFYFIRNIVRLIELYAWKKIQVSCDPKVHKCLGVRSRCVDSCPLKTWSGMKGMSSWWISAQQIQVLGLRLTVELCVAFLGPGFNTHYCKHGNNKLAFVQAMQRTYSIHPKGAYKTEAPQITVMTQIKVRRTFFKTVFKVFAYLFLNRDKYPRPSNPPVSPSQVLGLQACTTLHRTMCISGRHAGRQVNSPFLGREELGSRALQVGLVLAL